MEYAEKMTLDLNSRDVDVKFVRLPSEWDLQSLTDKFQKIQARVDMFASPRQAPDLFCVAPLRHISQSAATQSQAIHGQNILFVQKSYWQILRPIDAS